MPCVKVKIQINIKLNDMSRKFNMDETDINKNSFYFQNFLHIPTFSSPLLSTFFFFFLSADSVLNC